MVSKVNEITGLPLDVHLMIDNADRYVEAFAKAGADYISVHYENNYHLNRLLDKIKSSGVKAGVVLNPSSPVSLLKNTIEFADFILIMSVNPGFGVQKFILNSIDKILELREMVNKFNPDCLIEIDGGIGLDNIKLVSDAGVDLFVCGASIFKSVDRYGVIKEMKRLIS